jgi:hypothetical protein
MAKAAVAAAPTKKVAAKKHVPTIYEILIGCAKALDEDFAEQGAKETGEAYLSRLLTFLAEGEEDVFNEHIPEDSEALEYFNEAVTALNEEVPIPECPGFTPTVPAKAKAAPAPAAKPATKGKAKAAPEPEPEEEAEAEEEEAEEAEPEPAPKARAGKVIAKPAPAPAKAPARAAVKAKDAELAEEPEPKKVAFGGKKAAPFAKKPDGVTYQVRMLLAKNPDESLEKLREKLAKKGFNDVKASTLTTLKGDVQATIRAIKEVGKWAD